MKLLSYLKKHLVFLDGGTGTLLQERGLEAGARPEEWNVDHPDEIRSIHRAYLDAGCHILTANTFGANPLRYPADRLEAIVSAAMENAKIARKEAKADRPIWIALDVGPTGRMLKPYGDLDFEDAVAAFAQTVRLGVRCGADLILIETMSDSYEAKAALLAARENSDLPVFVSCAFGSDGKLLTGADPAAAVALLEGMRADAIGINCSDAPAAMMPTLLACLACSSRPVLFMPNAGLPRVSEGKTVYDLSPSDFAAGMCAAAEAGASILGGCCGTTPAHIRAMTAALADRAPKPVGRKKRCTASSYTRAVSFGERPLMIGERVNPTGKPRLKEALLCRDVDYLQGEAIRQQEAGADLLDVNVGLPQIDEPRLLPEAIRAVQEVCDLPLVIDSSDPVAMEAAMRAYNGKPVVNSVNGREESLRRVLPLVRKYGGVAIALTIDEGGVPPTAEGRLAVARRILAAGREYGLTKDDFLFDPLAMTVSADPSAASVTLRSLALIRDRLGARTSLGVSNVSYGLPARDGVNAAFLTLALSEGLSAAIANPLSPAMRGALCAFLALSGRDRDFSGYLAYAAALSGAPAAPVAPSDGESLSSAIRSGRRDHAAALTEALLREHDPLAVIREQIVPALNDVGQGYEEKRVFLPQLLVAAEAASAAFAVIRRASEKERRAAPSRMTVVLATVEGDVHDIGKNIVRLLLENYGFRVVDLGRDVPPARIVEAAEETGAPLVGLSALMTTTVPAMEKTIRLLRERLPACRVMVGGAVLTEAYAASIGADYYGKDAMAAVRCAEDAERAVAARP